MYKKKQNHSSCYGFLIISTNQGNTLCFRAVYVKVIDPCGRLKIIYETTYDNISNVIHI